MKVIGVYKRDPDDFYVVTTDSGEEFHVPAGRLEGIEWNAIEDALEAKLRAWVRDEEQPTRRAPVRARAPSKPAGGLTLERNSRDAVVIAR